MNLYLTGTYDEKRAQLSSQSRESLEAAILDNHYNAFLSDRADFGEKEADPRGHGKRLPYVGWFWRRVGFSNPKTIPIGNCGEFVGFMENNKWDYPQRWLTEAEAAEVIAIIDAAMAAKTQEDANRELARIWDYMQTLVVNE